MLWSFFIIKLEFYKIQAFKEFKKADIHIKLKEKK